MFSSNVVFDIPELLDAILCQVDIRTLLVDAQLVSRHWHDIITHSPSIQQVLYLHPKQSTACEPIENPFLAELFPSEPYDSGFHRAAATKPDVFLRKCATWRSMLVTQPPVLRLHAWKHDWGTGAGDIKFEELESPNGLRIGELYDTAQKWLSVRLLSGDATDGAGQYNRGLKEGDSDILRIRCYLSNRCVQHSGMDVFGDLDGLYIHRLHTSPLPLLCNCRT
ncbi:hypothetical protein BDP27DRAFT_1426627 [Rhodocollybia butyracea]|uniref:F-box domain-containing protein n=1 Tax=Rhodocollybia butyracea TaxID=206335 RepID=A0A9P5PGZ9_9AGAR|nr:hypothetical protein BDP27DRAFT_1426627 [Rhodocollybia butyracea]